MDVRPPLVIQVHRTGEARVERMDRPEDLQGLLGIVHRSPDQRRLVRGAFTLRIAGRRVPRARDHELVIVDLLLLDDNPVCQRPPRGLGHTDPPGFLGPRIRIPPLVVEHAGVPVLDVCQELRVEFLRPAGDELRFDAPGRGTAERREKRILRNCQRFQQSVNGGLGWGVALAVSHQNARQRSYFHRLAIVARRLHPRVLVEPLQELQRRLRPGIVRRGLAFIRVQSLVVTDGIDR